MKINKPVWTKYCIDKIAQNLAEFTCFCVLLQIKVQFARQTVGLN